MIQASGWIWRPACAGRPYSLDLRERAVRAVAVDGLSCRAVAARFDQPRKIAGDHPAWLVARCHARAFTLRGLIKELGERGLRVDYRSVWEGVRAEKLTYKKRRWSPASATAPMSPDGGANG